MVNMDDFFAVRIAHRDGMGINQLAQTFHHSKRKIREILANAEPKAYRKRQSAAPRLDEFKPIIDAILKKLPNISLRMQH